MNTPEKFIIAVTLLPDRPNEPPGLIRLRRWLKAGRRVYRIRAEHAGGDVKLDVKENQKG